MKHLTSEQRYEIYLGRKRGWSKSRIAREIGVHPTTVGRELQRNCNSNGGMYGSMPGLSRRRVSMGFRGIIANRLNFGGV